MSTNNDYQNLMDYIIQLFGISTNHGMIDKQISQFHNQYGYSYSGIEKSLRYWFEVKGNSVSDCHGTISIVASIYGEAMQYYKDMWNVDQLNKTKTFKLNNEVKEIKIDEPTITRIKSAKDIEIENFMNGEDV